AHQRTHEPALRLPLFAEEKQVMTGKQADVDFRNDRVLVADDAWKEFRAGRQHAEEVVANLLLDRLRRPATGAKFLERGRTCGGGHSNDSPLIRSVWRGGDNLIVAGRQC